MMKSFTQNNNNLKNKIVTYSSTSAQLHIEIFFGPCCSEVCHVINVDNIQKLFCVILL